MSTTVTMIGEVPIFGLLDDEEREALAQLMDCRDFKAGETIFHYGDAGGEIFILRTGRVELFIESTEGTKIVLSENETRRRDRRTFFSGWRRAHGHCHGA